MENKRKNQKSKKNMAIKIIVIVVAFIFALLAVSTIGSIKRYHDKYTWAKISVTGKIYSDTSSSFSNEYECLKGDTIPIDDVTLIITNITTDGTVTFSVQKGDLYDESGKKIDDDTIFLNAKSNYKLNNGVVSLTVTNNWYL